tara:strand:+ start:235 stop:501 length:267 start_codon:yes stop_codon:yes gene_type:complete
MVEILAECSSDHEASGARTIAIFFLSMFVLLILVDAFLTWMALRKTMSKDAEEVNRLRAELKKAQELSGGASRRDVSLVLVRPSDTAR